MAEFTDVIERVRRRLQPVVPMQIALAANYTAGSGTMTVATGSPQINALQPGALLGAGLNVLLVTTAVNTGTGVVGVVGGLNGSTDANAANGSLIEINPRFQRWDISQEINGELLSLDAPTAGLGQIKTVQATFIPVFAAYDLGAGFDTDRSKVLEVNFKIAPPYRTYPLIRRGDYRVIRHADTAVFPNGSALRIFKPGWPGFPITVYYLAPFVPLVNLTDDLLGVAGVPLNMQDIVEMGAALRLAPDREIARNAADAQPDPRKAPEVPPGAMRSATDGQSGLYMRYMRRRNEEASRIKRSYPNAEGW